jgi:uncharacterized repeat protein (TIGR02543 family)
VKSVLLLALAAALLLLLAGCPITAFYTVSFDSQGGSAVPSQKVESGKTAAAPSPAPTKAGYDLPGWYKEAALTTAWDFAGDLVAGDTTLYAKWAVKAASAASAAALEAVGEITLAVPKADGSSDAAVKVKVEAAQVTITVDGTAITAAAGQYLITDDAIILKGKGEGGADVAIGYVITADNKLAVTGGLDKLPGAGLASGPVTSAPNAGLEQPADGITSYAIAYNLDGGTNHASNPATYAVESAVTLNAPTKTGYDFGGWFADAAFAGDAVTGIPSGSTGDKAFFAKWAAASYAIAYNLDGGANHASNPAAYTIESAAIALGAPTKSGYDFGGWFDNSGFTGTAATAIASGTTGDRAFWAKWTEKTYSQSVTVEFTDGGATLAVTPTGAISFSQGESKTLNLTGTYATIKWVADGVEKSTSDSVTLNGADYGAGAHSLAIVVTKEGSAVPWTQILAFTVTE